MVGSFTLIRTPKIIFGEGKIHDPTLDATVRGKNVLLVTGNRSWTANKNLENIFDRLSEQAKNLYRQSIGHEPLPSDIDEIAGRYRLRNINYVIAVGGGSVVDAGKAVSAMLPLQDSVKDFIEGVGSKVHPGTKVYFVAIPTTSGTGSEATSNAVLAETGEHGYKRSLRHENFMPDLALVDPQLTVSCPPRITAATGLDAFTQLMESYLSVNASQVTDVLALDGMNKVSKYLPVAFNNGSNPEARTGMSYAALLSGITLSNAGLGLVHGMAPVIGSKYNVPHGIVCGSLIGIVNRFNIEALKKQKEITAAHQKYATLGKMFSGTESKSMFWYMNFVADYIDNLVLELKIPLLGEYGITHADLELIAGETGLKANPVKFEKDEIKEIIRRRL